MTVFMKLAIFKSHSIITIFKESLAEIEISYIFFPNKH
jgi:hypothetical protein